MAKNRNNIERLDTEDIRSLAFVGVSMWAIFMVAIICLWVAPRHFGGTNIKGDENGGTTTNIADVESFESTEESTMQETEEVPTKLTELPEEWANATVRDYLQKIFFTDIASWGYKAGETPTEVAVDTTIHAKWGLPGGIWRQDGTNFLSDEMLVFNNYYNTTLVNGLYMTEMHEYDVDTLAQRLADAGVHVNILPKHINLGDIGTDGLKNFVEAMHNHGISAGIYCTDVSYLKVYIEMGIDIDCVVLESNQNDAGYRPAMNEPQAIREFFDGAILMNACTDKGGTAQTSKDIICEAMQAGCDAVSVHYRNGDGSARAVYAYGLFIEQESVTYANDVSRLQESVLRLINLDRSLWN